VSAAAEVSAAVGMSKTKKMAAMQCFCMAAILLDEAQRPECRTGKALPG
jgi:hypothetical protein